MKKFPLSLVLGGVLLGSVGLGTVAYADDKSGTTDVTVTFTKPQMKIPQTPNDHKDADTAATGASDLALLYVPKSFNFNGEINPEHDAGVSLTVDATGGSKEYRVGIGDVRGTNAGWKLTAQLSELQTDASVKLPGGTKLIFGATKLSSFKATDSVPVLTEVTTDQYDKQLNPTVSQTQVELDAGGTSKEIAKANVGKGSGYWDVDLSGISISIPDTKDAPLAAGAYKGTVTWNLADTPN